MKYNLLIFILLSVTRAYSNDISNPFAPVNEKIISNTGFFSDQPLSNLCLTDIIISKKGKVALIKDPNEKRLTIKEGDSLGKSSGRVILIEKNRVLVMVHKVSGGKRISKVEIIKKR
ncbi:MAG: pilus assembly protein PilP [Desulfobacterales bacterium]|nr:pilus assembly protein PilP [Desulfobacterales bacterium]